MSQLPGIVLGASALLSAAAILAFRWSVAMARLLLLGAVFAAAAGALAIALANLHGGALAWAFLFAGGAFGCSGHAAHNLVRRPTRWVHRFVIYAGYGATFATMAVVGLWLAARGSSGWLIAGAFFGVYVVGSACIFLAKTLTVRFAVMTMPEYQASLAAGQPGRDGPGYW